VSLKISSPHPDASHTTYLVSCLLGIKQSWPR
jgi:hypothetical protein